MVGDEVLKHLYSSDPRCSFVGYPSFSTNAHDHLVMVHAVHQGFERIGKHFSVCVNLSNMRPRQSVNSKRNSYHQADFKKIRGYAHKHMDFTEHVKVEWSHAIIISDPREEVHQNELTVALATIARFLICGLCFRSALDNYYRRCAATCTSCTIEIRKVAPSEAFIRKKTYCNDQHKPLRGSLFLPQIQPQGSSWVRGFRTADRLPIG